jgi:tetratricopeptide (TPR) repeat protein
MIDIVPDPEVNSPEEERQPVMMIPVPAEDVARRTWRIRASITIAVVVALAIAGYIYKRSVDPMNAQASYDAGNRLFQIARYNQAILSFDRAISLKPDLVDAYLMRGRSHVGNAEPELSLRDFSKVIEMRPNDPTGWIARGAASLEINHFDEAISDATQAVTVSPKNALAYNLRGAARRKSGDAKKALEDFNQAVQLNPTADNYYQRGATYQLLGDHRAAIADFDQVIAMIPDLANAFFARAASRRAIGDIAAAQKDHRQGRILDGH